MGKMPDIQEKYRDNIQQEGHIMFGSIQKKVFLLCISLVIITSVAISATYFRLVKQDKQQESRQRIQIAFDIMLHGFADQIESYTKQLQDFLSENRSISWATYSYMTDPRQIRSLQFVVSYFGSVANEFKKFGRIAAVNRLALYGIDRRLLVVFQRDEDRETIGGYVVTPKGVYTYLPLDDTARLSLALLNAQEIPELPLPQGASVYYDGDIPDTITTTFFKEQRKIGSRVLIPIFRQEQKTGVLVCEVVYTKRTIEGFASLSQTYINLFADDLFSIGTLAAQTSLPAEAIQNNATCEQLLSREASMTISSVTLNSHQYYQGMCVIKNQQQPIGAMTVSLSQDIETQAINRIWKAVLSVSLIAGVVALVLSVLVSQKTIHSIHNIVRVMSLASSGDLRPAAIAVTKDEIGSLAVKLNQMITQLRTISRQVRDASGSVHTMADTILQEMETLIRQMEQQSASVDNTTMSVEKIKHFIDVVAEHTNDLLTAAAMILGSIQETRASINEVTMTTGSLTDSLHRILSSVDEVGQTVKQITEDSGHLAKIAEETETEIEHIDQSLNEVSRNADHVQQLAKETMDAATSGQTSVNESIQGIADLKGVVANTAAIIQEVNAWGEQVSAILDIVDEITEHTALLSLNASIISAQAGSQGKGFAVVADEIKELAIRTKSSTKEIGTLVHKLQKKTEEGVSHIAVGLKKADQSLRLATAVKHALDTILERATLSSSRAADTAQLIQRTAGSGQAISKQMNTVTDMVSHIRTALQEQEQDIEQVVKAVADISGVSEQVNRASIEQKKAAEEIERNMEHVTAQFSDVEEQTDALRRESDQIVNAMHTVEAITENILQKATVISSDTVKNLVQQSESLQEMVNVFKVS